MLTHDLDFGAALAATHGERPSVVQIRAEDVSPDVIGTQVVAAVQPMASELDEGALLTVDISRRHAERPGLAKALQLVEVARATKLASVALHAPAVEKLFITGDCAQWP